MTGLITRRRGFLTLAAGLLVAPALAREGTLMRISPPLVFVPDGAFWEGRVALSAGGGRWGTLHDLVCRWPSGPVAVSQPMRVAGRPLEYLDRHFNMPGLTR